MISPLQYFLENVIKQDQKKTSEHLLTPTTNYFYIHRHLERFHPTGKNILVSDIIILLLSSKKIGIKQKNFHC